MVKERRKKKSDKIRGEKVKLSDWLQYLQQISTISINHYLTFYSMLIGFSAILIALIVYTNTRIEGISILDYGTIPHPIDENITRVVIGLQKQPGLVEWGNFAIIIGLSVFICTIIYYFNRSPKILTAKVAEKLQYAILSKQYLYLKNVSNIEKTWNAFIEEIHSIGVWKRAKLLKKRNEEPFNIWFEAKIKQACTKEK